MNKWVPISVWSLVFVLAIWVGYQRFARNNDLPEFHEQSNTKMIGPNDDGRIFVEVPWEQLPSVGDFHLTNQDGQEFSSAAETGHPYLVNFFFSTCPTICRQFNGKMASLLQQYDSSDLELVSITVDAEQDTPELLKKYAESFQADERWQFLTGQPYEVKQTGWFVFHVPVEKATHTEKIILIDRWGKIRDWFDWNTPEEIARLRDTVDEVLAETEPPFGKQVRTRYAYAGALADLWKTQDWLTEFKLTDTDGKTFYSKAQTGKVWVGSFFFSTCPGICQVQNQHLAGYQDRLREKDVILASMSTTPVTDTPAVLREYARKFRTDSEHWKFLTADEKLLVDRIGGEFFSAATGTGHHSSRLYVVDKWGNVRGDFDWQVPQQETEFWQLVDQLNEEVIPPKKWTRIRAGQENAYPYADEYEEDEEEADEASNEEAIENAGDDSGDDVDDDASE